jgi:hypothetical protein
MPNNRDFWRGREDFDRDRDDERDPRTMGEGMRWREERPFGRGMMGRGYGGGGGYGQGMYGGGYGGYGQGMYGGYGGGFEDEYERERGGEWLPRVGREGQMRGWGERFGGQRDMRERGLGERTRGFFGRIGEEIREKFGRPSRHYTRSDERIREDVYERLMAQDWVDADDVEVRCQGGEITLTGTVPSRRDKRLCEELAEAVLGVKDVHNQLRVVHNGGQFAATTQTQTETKKPRA